MTNQHFSILGTHEARDTLENVFPLCSWGINVMFLTMYHGSRRFIKSNECNLYNPSIFEQGWRSITHFIKNNLKINKLESFMIDFIKMISKKTKGTSTILN